MTITKAVTALRKGDHIVLGRPLRTNPSTTRTSAEVLRIVNSPFGLVIQCTHGIYLNVARQETVQVIP